MNLNRQWKELSKKVKYSNPWIKVVEHTVERPDGSNGVYGVIEKAPAVFVIAEDEDGSIFLLKEYRYPVGKLICNLPCGMVEDKDEIEAGKRELLEETGLRAKNWQKIGGIYIAPGFETTYGHVLLATGLDKSNLKIDGQMGDEAIAEVFTVSREKLIEMIKNQEIQDASTLASLMIYINWDGS